MITNDEIRMIQILTEVIFPGAAKAKVHEFIWRDMKSNRCFIAVYRKGLNQLSEGAMHVHHKPLLELNGDQLADLLLSYEKSDFFQLLRDHTLEGMFSDPLYGGNYKAFGWRMLGYAGPTFHPPETLNEVELPTVYYSLEGIAYEET
ncbi:gluconate 2-dehydrogenase subunit 3 family protein [Cohnella suwonensis]|uniref:Gluconate 2-dehydrogenase subunit 3 family protein n=1 Tax=Cohnella suwonensis TaxID=696072 RepID=A0ABW0LN04_9BACL